jgi:hypothetical protein
MYQTTNTRCAQRIHAATFAQSVRSLGISAVETEARSGELAREIAITTAGFGKRVMLVNARDLSEFGVKGGTAKDFMKGAIDSNEGILDVRIMRGSDAQRTINDRSSLRALLLELAEFMDAIIFDLPAHDEAMPAVYGPIAALVLDSVMLVATPSVTPAIKLKEALSWLRESGAVIAAIVLNDRYNPTLGDEINREFRRVSKYFPFLQRFVEGQVAAFPALNRHH